MTESRVKDVAHKLRLKFDPGYGLAVMIEKAFVEAAAEIATGAESPPPPGP